MSDEQAVPDGTEPHPAFSGPPVADDESIVRVPAADFKRFQTMEARLAELEATIGTRDAELTAATAAKDEAAKALDAQRAHWESQFAEATQSYQAVRQLHLDRAKSAAVSASIAGLEFVGSDLETRAKVAAKFARELEAMVEASEDSGQVVIREKGTGRPLADLLREQVGARENQLYFQPKSRGGAGTDATLQAGRGVASNPDGNPHPVGTVAWWGWRHRMSQPPPKVIVYPKSH